MSKLIGPAGYEEYLKTGGFADKSTGPDGYGAYLASSESSSVLPEDKSGAIDTLKSFGQGVIGRPGAGVAHGIGEAVLPTAGAALGGTYSLGLGAPGGAAAGQTLKEAANEWLPGKPKEETTLASAFKPAVDVALAAGMQKAGDVLIPKVAPYASRGFKEAWDAAGKLGDKIANALAWTSKIPKSSMESLRELSGELLDKVGTVSKQDLKNVALEIERESINLVGKATTTKDRDIFFELGKAMKSIVVDKDPYGKYVASLSPELHYAQAAAALLGSPIGTLMEDFNKKAIIFGLSGPIVEHAPVEEAFRHIFRTGVAGGIGHALGIGVPLMVTEAAVGSPVVARSIVGYGSKMSAAAADSVLKAVGSSAGKKVLDLSGKSVIGVGTGVTTQALSKGIEQEAKDHPEIAKNNPELLSQIAKDELKINPQAYK